MISRRSPCGLPVSPATISRPATSRSTLPDSQLAQDLRVTEPELPRTRNGGPEGRNEPAFRLPILRATERSRSLAPGGKSIPPTRVIPPRQRNAVSPGGRRSHYGRKTERTRRCAVVGTNEATWPRPVLASRTALTRGVIAWSPQAAGPGPGQPAPQAASTGGDYLAVAAICRSWRAMPDVRAVSA